MEVNNENTNDNAEDEINVDINSWVFVNASTTKNLQRVEELTEYLNNSESTSDSDSISVISETEELQSQDESCTCTAAEEDDKLITQENNANSKKVDNCTEICSFKNLQVKRGLLETESNIVLITTVIGICFFSTYLLWPKFIATQDEMYSEYDPETDITQLDFLGDVYDTEIWNYYSDVNNTCNSDLNWLDGKLDSDLNSQSFNSLKNDISMYILPEVNTLQKNEYAKHVIDNKQLKDKTNNKRDKKFKNKNSDHKEVKHKTQKWKSKENYLEKKDKYLRKKEKYLKRLEKEILELEAELLQIKGNVKKENDRNYPDKLYENATAGWYHKMFTVRSELRNKEKLSDWVFERSKMRSKLRKQDSWYFSRAKGREQLRFSAKFRSNPKIYKTYHF